MVYLIQSLYHQQLLDFKNKNKGLIEFEKIQRKSDGLTSFEFDDTKLTEIVFIYQDANGGTARVKVDLEPYGLTYNYVLDIIRPVFNESV